ncbi:MAG: hypothetical protein ACYDG2_24830 [Ruminiclostridium sp.]
MTLENTKKIEQWEQEIKENREILKYNKRVIRVHKFCLGFTAISFLIAFYIPIYLLLNKNYLECFIILIFIFWFKNCYKLTENYDGFIGKYIHLDKSEAIMEINAGIQNIKKRKKLKAKLKNGIELSDFDEIELEYNIVSSTNIRR